MDIGLVGTCGIEKFHGKVSLKGNLIGVKRLSGSGNFQFIGNATQNSVLPSRLEIACTRKSRHFFEEKRRGVNEKEIKVFRRI